MKNEQIAMLQRQLSEALSQVRMAMEEKFFRPEVMRPTPDPASNRLTDSQNLDDVENFGEEADGVVLAAEGRAELDTAIDQIAQEMTEKHPELASVFQADWAKEHAQ